MTETVEPLTFVVALLAIAFAWVLLIRWEKRTDAVAVDLKRRRGVWKADRDAGLCVRLWECTPGRWVWCVRPYEHTGPCLDRSAQHLRR